MRHAGETRDGPRRELFGEQPVIHRNTVRLLMIKPGINRPLRGMIPALRPTRGDVWSPRLSAPRKAGRAAPRWRSLATAYVQSNIQVCFLKSTA